ncbi:uncharacterized protein PRCAT00004634001 [Priceomyces carsonii]|uniref:uncharacterized protein n=1 Tax=Priceomyces carsonii TaxID=28549 RepID=UPI002ED79B30|nr:unnamed protein product [Priceomyces carsonii]
MAETLRINNDTFKLNQGVEIPKIGLGTYKSGKGGEAYEAVKSALKNGYTHIDTAARYGNEEEIGKAIKDSGIPREKVFITTKLWNVDHKNVEEALDTSLKKLKTEYIDLYLIHWPASIDPETDEQYEDWNYVETYKELQKLKSNTDKIRAIGISNFTIKKLKTLLSDPEVNVMPAVNQIEAHPLLPQPELYNYSKQKGIKIEAYSPLGSSGAPLFKNETINEIADKNGVDSANVLISWAIQRDTVVLPKSVTEARIINNLKTFTLPAEDFRTLERLSEKYGVTRINDPAFNSFED